MITFCIPSKNNLRYLKSCIRSIQQNSHYTNSILVFVDQDEDGTVQWLLDNNITHITNPDKDCKGIGYGYDAMFKASKTDLVVAFHADMILGPDADKYLVQEHTKGSVVSATRIEPPLHPPGPEKIVKDFGMWPEDIKWEDFNAFVKAQSKANEGRLGKTSFAPWLIDRRDHLGHDPIFLSVFEDADLFRRFILAEYTMIQSWSSLVYHLTCRGGQFAGAEKLEDFQKKDQKWLYNNQVSMLEYVRKWGGMFKEFGPCEPRPNVKYNIGAEVLNCTEDVLSLEPFLDQFKVDCSYANYLNTQEGKSSFNIKDKFVNNLTTDIVIKLDAASDGSLQYFNYILNNIEDIMQQVEQFSTYEFGPIQILVGKIEPVTVNINIYDTDL